MSDTQEKRLYTLVLVLVIVVAFLSGFAIYSSYSSGGLVTGTTRAEPKTISVSGAGTVSVDPDVGWFTASVTTQAQTAAQAGEQNNNAMAKVISALKGAGTAEKDIQTVDYSLSPIYQEAKETGKMPILVGYSVRHSIRVNVKDIAAVGRMLDLAVSSGANEVGGVYFGLSDEKAQRAQTEALDLAVKDANSKAKAIATSMGVNLVGPFTVNVGYYYAPARATFQESTAAQVPIMPGQLQYTVNVQISYAFR